MTKSATAIIVAIAIAFTTFGAAPARADSDDVAKALVGLAAIYFIGRAIKKNKEKRHQVAQLPKLPRFCLRTFHTPNGTKRYFGARCLNNNLPQVSLPQACKSLIWTNRGRRNVYGPNCLRQHGYQITAH